MSSTNKTIKFALSILVYSLLILGLFITAIIGSAPIIAFGFFLSRVVVKGFYIWISSNWLLYIILCGLPLFLFMMINLFLAYVEQHKKNKVKKDINKNIEEIKEKIKYAIENEINPVRKQQYIKALTELIATSPIPTSRVVPKGTEILDESDQSTINMPK